MASPWCPACGSRWRRQSQTPDGTRDPPPVPLPRSPAGGSLPLAPFLLLLHAKKADNINEFKLVEEKERSHLVPVARSACALRGPVMPAAETTQCTRSLTCWSRRSGLFLQVGTASGQPQACTIYVFERDTKLHTNRDAKFQNTLFTTKTQTYVNAQRVHDKPGHPPRHHGTPSSVVAGGRSC